MNNQDAVKLFVGQIAQHPHYDDFVQLVAKTRPSIPIYDPNDPISVEKWKVASSKQQGYDLFANLMRLRISDTDKESL